ncbi:MAG: hypothetical protein ACFCUI_11490 [Bernardetiaceae bacterium]
MAINIKRLVSDLTRLEVNTILNEGLLGSEPRSNRHMFHELAEDYRHALTQINRDLQKGNLTFQMPYGGQKSFVELYQTARAQKKACEDLIQKTLEEEEKRNWRAHLKMLYRITSHTENVLEVFRVLKENAPTEATEQDWNNDFPLEQLNKIPDLEIDVQELTHVRKAYEIGTQQILMQTVIQVDGDMTSYITPAYLKFSEKEQKMLMEMHHKAFTTSMSVWKYLFETIYSLAGGAINKVFKGKQENKSRA